MRLFALTAAALCLLGGEAAAAAPDVRLHALDCGRLTVPNADPFADDGAYKGVAKDLVVPCYLVRHPKGDLLWDTGVPQAIADMPGGKGPGGISVARKLTDQLKELGLRPEDVEYVSVSHSHFDHIGNAGLFARSTWIVDPDERAYAFRPQARANAAEFAAYSALENAKTILVEGDALHDVFGDGSVQVVPTPGHTPGHTVLLVRLPKAGPVLLTGDLWHIAESRAARRVPRFNVDRAQTLRSYDRVEALARETGARVVRQHVPEDFESLPRFPAPLR
ncbi:N-acyl homoserine lactonase family protein [Phenylobacterium sp.]|jgi:glyoxylase-like metal-dependent hydrolase (beta-lactamase superfamily II)|uniref:N-acyl homoserine lactonase family protein n=1 Tax=Phenylobacterium sp. TaxID=1871053 RepID=UPI002F93732D